MVAGLAFATKTIFFFTSFVSLAWAQGDFAPYQEPAKLKNIAPKANSTKVVKRKVKKRTPKRKSSQVAQVVIDGSAVYEAANFDAPVMEYLDRGKKVVISKKLYQGIGGLGAFYKIRLRKGVYGYITDVDVALARGKKADDDDDGTGDDAELESDPTRISNEMYNGSVPKDSGEGGTIYLRKYIGLAYYQYSYTETIAGSEESANTAFYGVKYSGPTKFLGGMPMDLDLLLVTSAPDFYSDFSTSTSGLMLFATAAVMIPLAEYSRWMVYYGFGPAMRFSQWDVTLKTNPDKKPVDSQEASLGVVGNLGAVVQLGRKIALRVDGKYVYEKEKYFGFGGALQIPF